MYFEDIKHHMVVQYKQLGNHSLSGFPTSAADILKVEKALSEEEGAPVKYVITTALEKESTEAYDVFYRKEPHPVFGNRYFGLRHASCAPVGVGGQLFIVNADCVEDLSFAMLAQDDVGYQKRNMTYSRHRHDFVSGLKVTWKGEDGEIKEDKTWIDGGRAYCRFSRMTEEYYNDKNAPPRPKLLTYYVRDGIIVSEKMKETLDALKEAAK